MDLHTSGYVMTPYAHGPWKALAAQSAQCTDLCALAWTLLLSAEVGSDSMVGLKAVQGMQRKGMQAVVQAAAVIQRVFQVRQCQSNSKWLTAHRPSMSVCLLVGRHQT